MTNKQKKKDVTLEALVLNFSFEGIFSDKSLLLGFLTSDSQAELTSLLTAYPSQTDMILTTLAFFVLQEKFSKQKAEWEMLAKKCKKWLKSVKDADLE